MTREEIMKNSGTIILAGSETTATLLSGVTFYLLKNPSAMSKLTKELRITFPDPADMTIVKLSGLPYLNACLQEALRIYPPAPGMLPRRTLSGGAMINGYYIPENISHIFARLRNLLLIKALGLCWYCKCDPLSFGTQLQRSRIVHT